MVSDKTVGFGLLIVSVAVIVLYGWLLFFPPRSGLDTALLKITAFVAVAVAFGILAWIGYTLATTPPPKPIEEIEKELEKELERIEEERKKDKEETS